MFPTNEKYIFERLMATRHSYDVGSNGKIIQINFFILKQIKCYVQLSFKN